MADIEMRNTFIGSIAFSFGQYGKSLSVAPWFRITPYEWENPHPCKPDPDEIETQWTFSNALWFGIASFLCQGSDILPK